MKKLICLLMALALTMPMSVLSYNPSFNYARSEAVLTAISLKLTEANNTEPIDVVISYKSYVESGYNGATDQIVISEGMYFYMEGNEEKLAYILAEILVDVRPTKMPNFLAVHILEEIYNFEDWTDKELYGTALAIDYLVRAGYSKDIGLTNEILYAYNPTIAGLMRVIFVEKYLKLLP